MGADSPSNLRHSAFVAPSLSIDGVVTFAPRAFGTVNHHPQVKERKDDRIKNNLEKGVSAGDCGRIRLLGSQLRDIPTPIAAQYRAALSISYLPMLLESLLGGLIIGFCVGYLLLRFFDKIPTQNPILKSVILSFIVLVIVTILLQSPASFLTTSDVLRYFLIGTMFNLLRILALGMVIGYLYKRLYTGFSLSLIAPESAQVEMSDRRHTSSTST